MPSDLISSKKILLHVSRLHEFDATSIDLMREAEGLRSRGHQVWIHARNYPDTLKDKVVEFEKATDLLADSQTTVIAQFCGFDRALAALCKASTGKVFLRYQNITPTKWFFGYAWKSFFHSFLGHMQIKYLVSRHRFDLILPASQFSADELLGSVDSQDRPPVIVVPVLANYQEFTEARLRRRSEELSSKKRTALYVSRILPHKGIIHLLGLMRAWSATAAAKSGVDLEIVVAGKLLPEFAEYLKEMKQIATKWNVEKNITFRTDVSHAELINLYEKADIYLCPSEHEGFGVPIVEAQSAGIPIVAIDCGATKETMGLGGLCIAKSTSNYIPFAEAVSKVILDTPYRQKLIDAGILNTKRFEDPIVISILENALQQYT